MALQLTDAIRPISAADAPLRVARPPLTGADGVLDRTVRLSVGLLRTPAAHAYIDGPEGLEIVAAYPASPEAGGAAGAARAIALEVLRAGGVVRREGGAESGSGEVARRDAGAESGSDEAAATPRSHLGVPLTLPSGRIVGALVVSDVPGRAWAEREIASLIDLTSIGMAGWSAPRHRSGADVAPWPGGAADRGSGGEEWRARVAGAGGGAVPAALFADARDAALVQIIRESVLGSLHLGALHAGDRLPSIRQTARAFAVTPYMVLQAYAELEVEGLVERRERSGIFVADFEVAGAPVLPETGAWLTEVLTQACQHQVKIPLLPDLIRRWTTAVSIRCACVESCGDSRFALAHELAQQFGIASYAVSAASAEHEVENADLVITTAYHAAELGPIAAAAGIPMLIATVSPLILSSALTHLRDKDLTVICVDPTYGERLRALHGGVYRERVRVVTADDEATLGSLDRSEAVLMTPAARKRLQQPDFRLVAPMFPSYSLEFARKVAEALVRINLSSGRA